MNKKKIIIICICLLVVFLIYNYLQKKKAVPSIYYLNNLSNNYNAHTIPPFGIFIKTEFKGNDALLQHELTHWHQYQQNGLIAFYTTYLSQLKKYGYDNMPMEIAARNNESEYCQLNYTDCVRTGQAATVYNPQFRS